MRLRILFNLMTTHKVDGILQTGIVLHVNHNTACSSGSLLLSPAVIFDLENSSQLKSNSIYSVWHPGSECHRESHHKSVPL